MPANTTSLLWHPQLVEITYRAVLFCSYYGLHVICSPLGQLHLILAICKLKGVDFKAYILDAQSVTWAHLCHFTQVEQQNQTSLFQSVISKPYLSGSKVTREEGLNQILALCHCYERTTIFIPVKP